MNVSLKPYPEYKESGQAWIGRIPAHWDIRRLKYLLSEVDARSEEGTETLLSVSQYTGVTPRHLSQGVDERDTRAESLVGYKVVKVSDLVVNIMLAWNGSLGVSRHDGIVSPAYCVYRFNKNAHPWFYDNLLRLPLYKSRIKVSSTGVVDSRLRLYSDDLFRLEAILPPLDDQIKISRFAHLFDERITQFIHSKRRLIALLNEQKQAIINRTVTRGLSPSAPLKSPGILWLGDIPRHWEVTKLYRITDPKRPIMYGIVLPGSNVDEGVYIVKGGNCEPGRLKPEHLSRTTFQIEARYARSRLRANDIVYSIRGSIGSAQVVPPELAGSNLTQDAARIAARDGICVKWLLYAVSAPSFFAKLDAGAMGAAVRGINIRDLKRADIAVPPPSEQQQIAEHLDYETATMDAGICSAQRELELLREYRTRLIADVVTGKLDVRDFQLPAIGEITEVIGTEAADVEPEDEACLEEETYADN